jgi:ribosomal protein S18 acetylase RimI-like enzyme
LKGIEKGQKMDIIYLEVDEQEIDIIRPLWEKLRDYHQGLSLYFAGRYIEFTFQRRKEELLKKSRNGSLKIDIAKDNDTKWLIGYCVSSISDELEGEVDSIYIEEDYRSLGIGKELIERAIKWMDANKVKIKRIVVAVGNEELLSFYSKYDFLPKHIILEQK